MSNLFFRNRRLLILTIGVIVVAGASSYHVIPRLEDPQLTNRFATVRTLFPGADAERVEVLVTEKLERELREIEEIKLVKSQSRVGISLITIELRDEVQDVDEVWSRVRDQVSDAATSLPADALEPEFEISEVGAYTLILAIVWNDASRPNYAILRRQAEELAQVLRAVPATEVVDLFGDPVEEILAEVAPDELAAMGMSVSDLARQLAASDAKVSAGQYRSTRNTFLLEVDSQLDSLERIRRTPIRSSSDDQLIPLRNVAQIRKGVRMPTDSLAVIDGRPAVVVAAKIPASARIDVWAASAEKAVDAFAGTLSDGLQVVHVFEQNAYVAARLSELLRNLLLGGAAVLVVMFFMMGWRSALIVGLTLPLASLMVLTGLRLFGIPLQQMSVTGLIIALGLLIDNAIVMVDDVRQQLREAHRPRDAVSASVRHLAIPLFGSSLTTALAFAPLALMPGPAGEFVGAIAVSVILAIFSSLLLSLTIVAALAAMGMPVQPLRQSRWWQEGVSHPRLTELYERSIAANIAHPARSVAVAALIPLLGILAVPWLQEQFFPPEERNQFQIEMELPIQTSLAQTWNTIERAREIVLAYPEVTHVDWFLGESAPSFYYNVIPTRENTSQYAQAIVTTRQQLKDKRLLRQLQGELDAKFPGGRVLVRQLEQGPPFDAPVEIRLTGPDLAKLNQLGETIRSVLAEVPDVIHTATDLSETIPQVELTVDEEAGRLAGLDNADISRQLDSLLEGRLGGSVLEGAEELPVRIRAPDSSRGDLGRISSLDIVPSRGNIPGLPFVPVQAVASMKLVAAPALIAHRNGNRVNGIRAYITAGELPSTVLSRFKQRLANRKFELPPGYAIEYGGEAAERNAAVQNLMANVAPLAVVMLASLVLTFGSFRMAALISGVGFLAVGVAMLMLWLFNYPFGFMAIIGTMGLVGVAINDSIVVLAALQADVRARSGDSTAVRSIVLRSTRHVVATSLTTFAGFLPLLFWGGAFWEPLAITIAGGVLGATMLALFAVPSAYAWMRTPQAVAGNLRDFSVEQPVPELLIAGSVRAR
jgi:multidrug efflux pump subunit AcrB